MTSINELKNLKIIITDGFTFIPINQILAIKAYNAKSKIILANGKEIINFERFNSIALRLPHNFQKVHRSYIININYVLKINKFFTQVITLQGYNFPIGKSFKIELEQFLLNNYLEINTKNLSFN